ncbi:MAG: arsenate reductase ArsC [Candidatus Lokiarchaeota archaeon]|nr:arsenate reductase ArsC [Candidatus Lokiarchaeota archaeon]
MDKTNLIFLCTHNQALSQMAEAIMKDLASVVFNIYSAGFEAKEIHPYAIKVMEEKGYDLSEQTSKDLKQFLGNIHFGIIITLCKRGEEQCPIIPGISKRYNWEIKDLVDFKGSEDGKIEKFREIRDLLEKKIKLFLEERGISIIL